jgi:hypothetical protein
VVEARGPLLRAIVFVRRAAITSHHKEYVVDLTKVERQRLPKRISGGSVPASRNAPPSHSAIRPKADLGEHVAEQALIDKEIAGMRALPRPPSRTCTSVSVGEDSTRRSNPSFPTGSTSDLWTGEPKPLRSPRLFLSPQKDAIFGLRGIWRTRGSYRVLWNRSPRKRSLVRRAEPTRA